MKRVILSATLPIDEELSDALAALKADFDYLISGLEKLGRSGAATSKEALVISENINSDISKHLNDVANVSIK